MFWSLIRLPCLFSLNIHTCRHVSAYGLFGMRAHAPLSMWVHSYSLCDIQRTLRAHEFRRHLCACLSLLWRLYSHHSPSPHPPILPWDQTSPVSFPQATTIRGDLWHIKYDDDVYASNETNLVRCHTWLAVNTLCLFDLKIWRRCINNSPESGTCAHMWSRSQSFFVSG